MSNLPRALAQIEAIHDQLARAEIYRGWRSLPVALSGVFGLAAAAWQSASAAPIDPIGFVVYWLVVGVVALAIGCAEIVWHYGTHATSTERHRSRRVLSQFLPALVAGAIATGALLHLSPALAAILPGLWAMLFGVAVFAARPYLPRASGWVGLYYWATGLALLWRANGVETLSPWMIGGTFGLGQLLAALVLYLSLERPEAVAAARLLDGMSRREKARNLETWRDVDDSQTR